MTKKAVLLIDYGGPEKIADIAPYLNRLFNDFHILPFPPLIRGLLAAWIAKKRLQKATKIYEQLGGSSPINPTVKKLCKQLNQKQDEYEFIPAFLFQPPLLPDQLRKYPEAIIFPLFPHYSKSTWGIINHQCRPFPKTLCVAPYFDHPFFMQLIYNALTKQLSKYKDSSSIFIFCTAHAIPLRQAKKGDPYVHQLERQLHLMGQYFPTTPIRLGFQSRLGPIRWTTPSIEDVLASCPVEQLDTAIVLPLSFTIDNSETLIELDKQYASLSKEYGIKMWSRQSCLNTADDFQDFILRLVKET